MPLEWFGRPLDASLARLRRAKAIEALRAQLQAQDVPPAGLRLQLADLLAQAGREAEAAPILLGLADEFALDGFVAQAVAILKRVERLDPDRADVTERLTRLVRQQAAAAQAMGAGEAPELGVEEVGDEAFAAFVVPEPEPSAEASPSPEAAPVEAGATGGDVAAELNEDAERVRNVIRRYISGLPGREGEAPVTAEPEAGVTVEPEAEVPPGVPPAEAPPVPSPVVAERAVGEPEAPSVATPVAEPPAEPAPPPEPPPVAPIETAAPPGPESDVASAGQPPALAAPPPSDEPAAEAHPAAPASAEAAPTTGFASRLRSAFRRFLSGGPAAPEPRPEAPPEPVVATASATEAEGAAPAPAEAETAPSDKPLEETVPASPSVEAEPAASPASPGELQPAEPAAEAASVTEASVAKAVPSEAVAVAAEAPAPVAPPEPEAPPVSAERGAEAPATEPARAPAEAPAEARPPVADVAPPAPVVTAAVGPVPPAPQGHAAPADEPTDEALHEQMLDLVGDVLHRRPREARPGAGAIQAHQLLATPLFRDLDEAELLAVVEGLELRAFEPGDVVVTEGEPGGSLYVIASGRLRVFIRNPAGRNFAVGALAAGDFFGEIASLSGRPRTATITTCSPCELLELDRETLTGIARRHPRVRDVLEARFIERASSPEAAAIRAVPVTAGGRAIEILEAHFGQSRWDPRMRLRLADVLIKAGKHEDAVPVLVGLADDLARAGYPEKAIAILKKIERIQRRDVEEVNLAPLVRREAAPLPPPAPATTSSAAPLAPHADTHFRSWLVDVVRDLVQEGRPAEAAPVASRAVPAALGGSPLFAGFSEEELFALVQGLRLTTCEPGEVILTEGEQGEGVFLIATGEVKVFMRDPRGHDVALARLGEGAFFGEISTLSGRPRSASVVASARCELLELDRRTLDAIGAVHPRVRAVLEEHCIERAASPVAERIRTGRPPAEA